MENTATAKKGTIRIDAARCKGCLLCIDACPHALIEQGAEINDQGYQAVVLNDPEGRCTGCTLCGLVCPDICITVLRRERAPA